MFEYLTIEIRLQFFDRNPDSTDAQLLARNVSSKSCGGKIEQTTRIHGYRKSIESLCSKS
jgi:hypothetical protein